MKQRAAFAPLISGSLVLTLAFIVGCSTGSGKAKAQVRARLSNDFYVAGGGHPQEGTDYKFGKTTMDGSRRGSVEVIVENRIFDSPGSAKANMPTMLKGLYAVDFWKRNGGWQIGDFSFRSRSEDDFVPHGPN